MIARIHSTKQVSFFFCKKMIFFFDVDKANVMFLVTGENGKENFKGIGIRFAVRSVTDKRNFPIKIKNKTLCTALGLVTIR